MSRASVGDGAKRPGETRLLGRFAYTRLRRVCGINYCIPLGRIAAAYAWKVRVLSLNGSAAEHADESPRTSILSDVSHHPIAGCCKTLAKMDISTIVTLFGPRDRHVHRAFNSRRNLGDRLTNDSPTLKTSDSTVEGYCKAHSLPNRTSISNHAARRPILLRANPFPNSLTALNNSTSSSSSVSSADLLTLVALLANG